MRNIDVITIGIDPGKTGAIVALKNGVEILLRQVTPINEIKGRKIRKEYNFDAMLSLLDSMKARYVECQAVIERQQAFPGQGATSGFSTGLGYGAWLMALTAIKIPFTVVSPVKWTKIMLAGIPGEGKGRNIIAAQQLVPNLNLLPDIEAGGKTDRCRKPHDGIADAGLLARWACSVWNPQLIQPLGKT